MPPRIGERQAPIAARRAVPQRRAAPAVTQTAGLGHELQRRMGNAGLSTALASPVQRAAEPPPQQASEPQPKIARSPAGVRVSLGADPAEREAEAIAKRAMSEPRPPVQPVAAPSRMPTTPPASAKVARRAAANAGAARELDHETMTELKRSHVGGTPLPRPIRHYMEYVLHADFSGVRIHNDERAVRLAKGVDAVAFAYGRDIYFARGAYNPETRAGGELLAHELVHTIQQRAAAQRRTDTEVAQRTPEQVRHFGLDNVRGFRPGSVPITHALDVLGVFDRAGGFGTSFDGVRIHGGLQAVATNVRGDAAGNRIIPAAGDSAHDTKLLAHQTAHVQQRDGGAAFVHPAPADAAAAVSVKATLVTRPSVDGDAEAGTPVTTKAPARPQEDPAYQAVIRQLNAKSKAEKEPPKKPRQKQIETKLAANLEPQEAGRQDALQSHLDALGQAQPHELTEEQFMGQFKEAARQLGEKLPPDKEQNETVSAVVAIAMEKQSAARKLAAQEQAVAGPLQAAAKNPVDPRPGAAPEQHTLQRDPAGPQPAIRNAGAAAAKPRADAEISLDDKSTELDDVLRNHDVQGQKLDISEESLAYPRSGEATFDEAGETKRKAQEEIAKAGPLYRAGEKALIGQSQGEMKSIAEIGLGQQHDLRGKSFGEVLGAQNTHKDNVQAKKRAFLHDLETIYGDTKKKVESELAKIGDIEETFETIVNEASDCFASRVKQNLEYIYIPGFFDYSDWKSIHAEEIAKERDALLSHGENFIEAGSKALDIVRKRSADRLFENEKSYFISHITGGVEERIAKPVVAALNAARVVIADGKERVKKAFDKLAQPEQVEMANVLAAVTARFESLDELIQDRQREIVTDMARTYNKGVAKLHTTFDKIKKDVLTSWFEKAWNKLKAVVNAIIEFASRIGQLLGRLAHLVGDIIASPRAFFSNLASGIKQGFSTFIGGIGEFLATAFFDWLRGASGLAVQIPKSLDAKGIFGLFTQLLDVRVETVWERMEVIYGKATAAAFRRGEAVVAKGVRVFEIIRTEGLGGLWEHIKELLGDMLSDALDGIKETVLFAAIRKAITEIGKLLVPLGGFIAIAEKVIGFLQFIVEARNRILDLIEFLRRLGGNGGEGQRFGNCGAHNPGPHRISSPSPSISW